MAFVDGARYRFCGAFRRIKMKTALGMGVILLALLAAGAAAPAQQMSASTKKPTIASTLDFQLTIVEHEITGAAEAMPEDKYSFAPTNGEFKGVRTFALQVKHIATANNRFFGAILGEEAMTGTVEDVGSNGPDSIQTKAQILQYLNDSFAKGHKAIATITDANALEPVDHPPVPFLRGRMQLAIFACTHAFDHYGQMVEYLRDNGIVPPATQQRQRPQGAPQGGAQSGPQGGMPQPSTAPPPGR
jgi:uncharacterized damage-inducible protein DinB